jgi:hypothetical protein
VVADPLPEPAIAVPRRLVLYQAAVIWKMPTACRKTDLPTLGVPSNKAAMTACRDRN